MTSAFADQTPKLWLDRTVQYWQSLIGSGAVVETPEAKANQALLASHVDQFINNDHGVVQGGEVFYDIFYIRDGAYEVQQFEEAGFLEAARASLAAYLAAQRPDGRFETQEGQFDANGQAIWTLWQYYLITGDSSWLEQVYPAMQRRLPGPRKPAARHRPIRPSPVCCPMRWLTARTSGTDSTTSSATTSGTCAASLHPGGRSRTGRDADAAQLAGEAESYREAIDAAWKRTGLPHFPPSGRRPARIGATPRRSGRRRCSPSTTPRRGPRQGGPPELRRRVSRRHHSLVARCRARPSTRTCRPTPRWRR